MADGKAPTLDEAATSFKGARESADALEAKYHALLEETASVRLLWEQAAQALVEAQTTLLDVAVAAPMAVVVAAAAEDV